jgi:16S rRNA U1498 N3-methylase RsmE
MDACLYAEQERGKRPSEALEDGFSKDLALLVGPREASPLRRGRACMGGGNPVALGRSILRTETPRLVLVAAVRCHFGLL